MEKKYLLQGLDCANCAMKIEQAVNKLPEVKQASVDFATTKMTITCEKDAEQKIETEAAKVIKKMEPDVQMVPLQKQDQIKPNEQSKRTLLRIGVTGLLFAGAMVLPSGVGKSILFLLAYLLIGGDIVKKAVMNILHGEIFDENFLMTIATIGALAIGEFPEAVAVMWLYQIGEYFQEYAVGRSRKSVAALLAVKPDMARIITSQGEQKVAPEDVLPGALLSVYPGEKIPLDGIVKEGSGYIDVSVLTGESIPRFVKEEEMVQSGAINQEGRLVIEATKPFGESTVSRILDLVENASSQKAPAEKFITKFARYYTPAVVILAVLLVAVPTVFFQQDFHEWLYRGLTFLVISCPCALVISVPLSFFGGIGGASKAGILVKGSNYLEILAKVDTVVFDKTGTLTEGRFAVQTIATDLPEDEFLRYAAAAEQSSNHPIARSITAFYSQEVPTASNIREIAGHGIQAEVDGKQILVGNRKLFEEYDLPPVNEPGTVIYVAVDHRFVGYLVIADQIKEDAKQAVSDLQKAGVKEMVMLTGDNQTIGNDVAKKLGLTNVFSELLPEDKVEHLKAIMGKTTGKTAFVGDGINDAPVLATADVGVAMGGLGSDAAIEAADVVIMDDASTKLAQAIRLARKTLRIVKQNIIFALAVKGIVLILGAVGFVSMGAAVFADVGVTLLAVLNAMRCLKVKY
ncbi:heavy metal translocating P-type ATPase [Enterococcus mediterraneensis]|uniref:heavy metal translocating P-type ATPase n=1 Tax=Enterococcus mediterraneensis TaxID=2364791 RepID=UPI000F060B30|nr:heavy metal translocating P-type ATPase [Enterococcus mediterraneensis]